MIRTQIQLTEQQSVRLREMARRSGVSVAEVIRQSVDRFLEQSAAPSAAASGFPGPATRLAALEIVGRFHGAPPDISLRHDDYLDQAYLPPEEA